MSDKKYIELGKVIGAIMSSPMPADWYCAKVMYVSEVQNLQPADVAPVVHGHWIEELGDVISCRCSRCDHSYNLYEDDINGYPYCAWCGAKMDEREGNKE